MAQISAAYAWRFLGHRTGSSGLVAPRRASSNFGQQPRRAPDTGVRAGVGCPSRGLHLRCQCDMFRNICLPRQIRGMSHL